MSELRDRLERLAARGTRRGADDVLAAAQRGVPESEIAIVPDDFDDVDDFDGPDLPIIGEEAPFVTATPPRERTRIGNLVAAFGIAALLGVGMLAVTAMFGSGGADSPEGAVRQLADAISHKDPLAAVDVLASSEVRAAHQTVDKATHRAADLKIVNDAAKPLAGVDLSISNLTLSTENLADGYAKVTVTGGEITASTRTAAMSQLLQDAIDDEGNPPEKVELARLASDLPTFVITVRRGGGWYVSPAYTALEYAREAADGPAAEFGSAKTATLGADSPEGAVDDAVRALQANDWNRLMALAPPEELPVYDYRKWIGEAAVDAHADFTIDRLTTSADVRGDTATVKLEAAGTTGSGSDQNKWQVGGTCPSYSYDWYGEEDAANAFVFCLAGDLGRAVPFGLLMGGSDVNAAASGSISVEVVRENGRWYISPVSSLLKGLDSAIDRIDQRTVYTALGLAYKLPTDGTITLDKPFALPDTTGFLSSAVFEFQGTKGQDVVGEISKRSGYVSGHIYTADGKDLDYFDFSTVENGYGYPVTLPETGSYRLVVNGPTSDGATLTVWDAKNAPKGLLGDSNGVSSGENCTTDVNGGETCSYSGSSGDFCKITNNALVCGSGEPIPICAEGAAADTEAMCISDDMAKSMTSSGTVSPSSPDGGWTDTVTATTSPATSETTPVPARVGTAVP